MQHQLIPTPMTFPIFASPTGSESNEQENAVADTSLYATLYARVNLTRHDTATTGTNLSSTSTGTAVQAALQVVWDAEAAWLAQRGCELEVEYDVYIPLPQVPTVDMTIYLREIPYAEPHVILDLPADEV